jgi:hypothetical protein
MMRNLSPEDFTLLWAGIEGYADGYQPNSQEMARNKRRKVPVTKAPAAVNSQSTAVWRSEG